MSNKIRHAGVIEAITEDCVKVKIMQTSACSACKLASHCSASEQKEKVVEVFDTHAADGRHVGDNVVVSTSLSTGMKAVMVGFVLPFAVMVATLVLVLQFTGNEALAALSGLASLVPCYLVIWLMRDKLRGKFSFVIER